MNTLIVVTGPTASGKTDLSVKLAEKYGCEIISADSRQFYKGLIIGTAAPTQEILTKVKHHFVGFIPVTDYYSVSRFERDVLALLPSLFSKNSLAIMTGGSGLYLDAVCNGIDEMPDADPEIRNRYSSKLEKEGIESLRQELKVIDPEHYGKVDLRNPRRIMRALEVFAATGQPYSSFLTREKVIRDFRIIKVGLMPSRDQLYSRINARVDKMMVDGLLDEAGSFFQYREFNALKTVGYRELFDHFEGKTTLNEAVELIKRNTRRYARRQITWWTRDTEIKWYNPANSAEISDLIDQMKG